MEGFIRPEINVELIAKYKLEKYHLNDTDKEKRKFIVSLLLPKPDLKKY
jgi:hypothetical protein